MNSTGLQNFQGQQSNKIIQQKITILEFIFNKVKENINIHQIAYHIRQYVMETNSKCEKKYLLDFFLKCQSKLKQHSDSQWCKVFQINIKQLKATLRIFELQYKQILKYSFSLLKKKPNQLSLEIIQTSLTEYTQYSNMEVDQEIKIKTKYFFQWCQYIQKLKVIRYQKLKEINNLKKSQTFNNYALKFNMLMRWKKYLKYLKIQISRVQYLKLIDNKRIFKECINLFKEKYQIKTIENILENLVDNKIKIIKSRKFIESLRLNANINKRIRQQNKIYSNIWCYRALETFSKNLIESKTKTSQIIKKSNQKQYQRLCCFKVFQFFKSILLFYNSKTNIVRNIKKKKNLLIYKQIVKNQQINNLKKNSLKDFIKIRKVLFSISMLSINKANRNQQKKLQSQLIKIIKAINFTKFIKIQKQHNQIKKNNNNHKKEFRKQFLIMKIHQLKKKIQHNKQKNLEQAQKIQKVNFCIMSEIFKTYSNTFYIKKVLQERIKKIYHNLNLQLLKKSFVGFKLFSSYKQIQQQLLIQTGSIYNNIIKKYTFCKINKKMYQNKKINLLCQKTQPIVVRYIYNKIFSTSLAIKKQMNLIYHKRAIKLKQYLFSTLKIIAQIKNNKILQLNLNLIKDNKKRFIKNIKMLFSIKKNIEELRNIIDKNQSADFFKSLKISKLKNQQIENKLYITIKSISIIRIKFFILDINIKKQMYLEKFHLLQKQILNKQFLHFKHKIKKNQKQNQQIQAKKSLLQKKIFKKNFLRLTQSLYQQLRYNKLSVDSKKKKLKNYLILGTFKVCFLFANSQKKIFQIKKNMELSFLRKFEKYLNIKKNMKKVERVLMIKNVIKNLKYLKNHKKAYLTNEQSKIKQLQMLIKQKNFQQRNKQKQKIKQFFQLTKQFDLFSKNTIKIKQKIKKNSYQRFLYNYLQLHNQMIKKKISTLHYARNLKKKILLRMALNSQQYKQKQNNEIELKKNKLIKIQQILQKSRRSDKITDKIHRFNISKSRQILR